MYRTFLHKSDAQKGAMKFGLSLWLILSLMLAPLHDAVFADDSTVASSTESTVPSETSANETTEGSGSTPAEETPNEDSPQAESGSTETSPETTDQEHSTDTDTTSHHDDSETAVESPTEGGTHTDASEQGETAAENDEATLPEGSHTLEAPENLPQTEETAETGNAGNSTSSQDSESTAGSGGSGGSAVGSEESSPETSPEESESGEDVATTTATSSQSTGGIVASTTPATESFAPAHTGGGSFNPEESYGSTHSEEDETTDATSGDGHEGEHGSESVATSTIATGNGSATANIANIANTNIIGSNGGLLFINNATTTDGSIDLRGSLGGSTLQCLIGECLSPLVDSLVINATNTAHIINDIEVHAETGHNSIHGGGTITTGDATAALNLVNLVNTNIVGSDYLLFFLNNFGDFNGDIILPGQKFFEFLAGASTPGSTETTIANQNNAIIENNGTTNASTGDNTVLGSGQSTITTGDITTQANIFNVANQNLTAGQSIYLLFNVTGAWNGDIVGLPAGLSWERLGSGVRIFPTLLADNVASSTGTSSTTLSTWNDASIVNNFDVSASTGGNTITTATTTHGHTAHSAEILTGDARAVANVVNVVNTNIYGSNWLMAFVNIFGNWNGNLSFGQPNLWVGQKAEVSKTPVVPATVVSYTTTVINKGDTDATNVVVSAWVDPEGAFLFEDLGGGTIRNGRLVFEIPLLREGETRTFSYTARVQSFTGESRTVLSSAEARAFETDANYLDNKDSIGWNVTQPTASSGGGSGGGSDTSGGGNANQTGSGSTGNPTITSSGGSGGSTSRGNGIPLPLLLKHNNSSAVADGTKVTYKIVVRNDGQGSIYNATLYDKLTDPSEEVLSESTWPLDLVYPGEEIEIEYDVMLRFDAKAGTYKNKAQLNGQDQYGNDIALTVAESHFTIVSTPIIEIQGGGFFLPPMQSATGGGLTSTIGQGGFDASGTADSSVRGSVTREAPRRTVHVDVMDISSTSATETARLLENTESGTTTPALTVSGTSGGSGTLASLGVILDTLAPLLPQILLAASLMLLALWFANLTRTEREVL